MTVEYQFIIIYIFSLLDWKKYLKLKLIWVVGHQTLGSESLELPLLRLRTGDLWENGEGEGWRGFLRVSLLADPSNEPIRSSVLDELTMQLSTSFRSSLEFSEKVKRYLDRSSNTSSPTSNVISTTSLTNAGEFGRWGDRRCHGELLWPDAEELGRPGDTSREEIALLSDADELGRPGERRCHEELIWPDEAELGRFGDRRCHDELIKPDEAEFGRRSDFTSRDELIPISLSCWTSSAEREQVLHTSNSPWTELPPSPQTAEHLQNAYKTKNYIYSAGSTQSSLHFSMYPV